jgi:hypothetical protein
VDTAARFQVGAGACAARPFAAIYDIHGNLPALEAVLEEIHRAEVDHLVVGGDVVPGPMPLATLACLLSVRIPRQCIYGNSEVAVLAQMAGNEPVDVSWRPVDG